MSADAERDRVVAWLRELSLRCEGRHLKRWNPFQRFWKLCAIAYRLAADAIERGDHLPAAHQNLKETPRHD